MNGYNLNTLLAYDLFKLKRLFCFLLVAFWSVLIVVKLHILVLLEHEVFLKAVSVSKRAWRRKNAMVTFSALTGVLNLAVSLANSSLSTLGLTMSSGYEQDRDINLTAVVVYDVVQEQILHVLVDLEIVVFGELIRVFFLPNALFFDFLVKHFLFHFKK